MSDICDAWSGGGVIVILVRPATSNTKRCCCADVVAFSRNINTCMRAAPFFSAVRGGITSNVYRRPPALFPTRYFGFHHLFSLSLSALRIGVQLLSVYSDGSGTRRRCRCLRVGLALSRARSPVLRRLALVAALSVSLFIPGHSKVQLLLQAPPGIGLGVALVEKNGAVSVVNTVRRMETEATIAALSHLISGPKLKNKERG